jgi:Holliday junction resolvase RusA-like endonuclease
MIIYVPSVPVAQPRVKATSRCGRAGVYTPTTIKNADGTKKPHPIVQFKHEVKEACRKEYQDAPLKGPLEVNVTAVFPRKNFPKKQGGGRVYHTAKPDRDNLDKAILDAMKGIIFEDDKQVCRGSISKVYAAIDEQPHVEVIVVELIQQGKL